MDNGTKITLMSDDELMKKWLSTFGKNVDKGLIEEHVTSYGNLLWHLFTWGEVPCLKGEEARKAWNMRKQYDFTMDMPVILKKFL